MCRNIALLILVVCVGCGDEGVNSGDRAALVALYNATDGANWRDKSGWLSNSPIGEWHGVTTYANGRVTDLNLSWNKLSGSIPAELSNLSNLKRLDFGGNELTGSTPTALGSLSNLELLDLSGNQLTGTIPSWMGNLTNLKRLDLSGNAGLSGPLPGSFTGLDDLVYLYVDGTALGTPTDAAFQLWLQGVENTRGVVYYVNGGSGNGGPVTRNNWCTDAQTVEVSFTLQENGKTVSICRDASNNLVYTFGVYGSQPELEYRGPILGKIRGTAVTWGGDVTNLAELASALGDENSNWFNPQMDVDAIAKAARARETNGFYIVNGFTGQVDQYLYIFRTGGWEYAVEEKFGRAMNVSEDELEEMRSSKITVESPNGKTYHMR